MPITRRINRASTGLLGTDHVDDNVAQLREWVRKSAYKTHDGKPIIFLILRSRAASGVSRVIAPVIFTRSGPLFPTYRVAQALGMRADKEKEGIKISGAGMDMGFALIDHLASKIDIPLKHEWL